MPSRAPCEAPLYLVPGNHDIGDKPVAWMPAGMVDGESIALYRRHFGEDFRAFDHAGCHFVIINAPLINSEHQAEADQRRWLEADLAAHSGMRLFLFTHYPLYVSDAAEPESYDNIDEPGRGWLLGLIRRYQPEAVSCRSRSQFLVRPHRCDRVLRGALDLLRRGTTTRRCTALTAAIRKAAMTGAKLGHITLDIYENGHVAHYHRSYGATLAKGEAAPVALRPHIKTSSLTVILRRHAPRLGGRDGRRTVRRFRRVPPQAGPQRLYLDGALGDGPARAARADPRSAGRPHAPSHGDHDGRRALVSRLPIWSAQQSRGRSVGRASAGRLSAGARRELGRDRRKRRTLCGLFAPPPSSQSFCHASTGRIAPSIQAAGTIILISHGFSLEEAGELAGFLGAHRGLVTGAQFSISRSISPWRAGARLAAFAKETGARPFLYVKSTESSPAQSFEDDTANALRFAEAVIAGVGHGVEVILDTFDDADRGYFARTGLVDRRLNPRLAGEVISTLVNALGAEAWRPAPDGEPALSTREGNGCLSWWARCLRRARPSIQQPDGR